MKELLQRNAEWAAERLALDPGYFKRLSDIQKPHYLWIGCSDSRVPANVIAGLEPGEVFVHRNVANLVHPGDLNCLSVLQFAVEYLKVRQIFVTGHYGCGGVHAALSNEYHGLIDNWLRHIRNVKRLHAQEFECIETEEETVDRLCELNVIEQVHNVSATTIVRNAWLKGADLTVEGWVYSIKDGIVKRLCSRGPDSVDQDPSDADFDFETGVVD